MTQACRGSFRPMPVSIIAAKPAEQAIRNQSFRFIDIAVNLTDPVFHGFHHGRKKHDDDLEAMLDRSRLAGVKSMILSGGSLHESGEALILARTHGLFATVGCHPTRSGQFDQFKGGPSAYLQALDKLIEENLTGIGRVVAVGECGLDYDRTHFASIDTQKTHFRSQLVLAKKYHLPLFLHSRAAHSDFVQILKDEGFGLNGGRDIGGKGGVVHSFTGTAEEVEELMGMGFHISVNGCSLKTDQNLIAAKAIKPGFIMFETDAPWCSMNASHASRTHLDSLPQSLRSLYLQPALKPENFVYGKPVNGRNEPSSIGAVAWVIHKLNDGTTFERVTERAWKNTIELFGLHELAN